MEVVLNWIWQGALVGLATAALLRLLARTAARLRYRLLWGAVVAIVMLPLVPLVSAPLAPDLTNPGATERAAVATGRYAMALFTVPAAFDRLVLALCAIWTIAAAWRLARAAVAVRRVRRACRALPVHIEAGLRRWNEVRGSGRRGALALCGDVRTAGVLPGSTPVIAISPRLLDTLTSDELDRIVVHEWAHVQRYDDRAHVVQSLVWACAGWHPAIWWCDRHLHLEREMACDEMAVALTGSRKAYAACLARLATLAIPPRQPLPIVAAISASGVRLRVTRILESDGRGGRLRAAAVAAAAVALVTTTPIVGQVRVVAQAGVDAVADARPAVAGDDAASRASVARPDAGVAMRQEATQTATRTELGPTPRPALDRGPTATTTPDRRFEPLAEASADGSRPRRAASRVTSGGRAMTPAAAASLTPADSLATLSGAIPAPLPARALPAAATQAAPRMPRLAEPGVTADGPPEPGAGAPWDAAVSGGVALGRESREAAVATAGFFSRLGRRVAGSF